MNTQVQSSAQTTASFYKTAASIGVPVMISSLISIGLNMVDTLMIGRLGVLELSGVGAANRITFIAQVMCFGFYAGITIFLSQYWGIKDIKNIHRTLGIGYVSGFILCSLFTLAAVLFARPLMSLFSDDGAVIGYAVDYLHIVCFTYPLSAFSFLIIFACRSVHRPMIPTVCNATALLLNTFFNYCLIFGKFGFPAWGVKGAAVATLGSRVVELLLLLAYVYLFSKDHPIAARFSGMFPIQLPYLKTIFRTALPSLANEAIWSVGTSVYYIAFGMVNNSAIAVVQVAGVVNDFFVAIFYGVGNASMVMIGNELGRNRTQLAFQYGKSFIRIGLICCLFSTAALFFSRNLIAGIYNFDPFTNRQLLETLLVYALFTTPRMMGYVVAIGILRAGGDTRFCLLCDVAGIWCLGVPLSFLGAVVLHLPLCWVVALCFAEEVFKLAFFVHRFHSKRWINVFV
ncbi:MAG: MATE family efflux transporter [Firmicutes bacterium]|nr:MATE family efflux transporter [Bacillota bacterium]